MIKRIIKEKKKYFHGVEVSAFGARNGFVDYGTLMKLAEPLGYFEPKDVEEYYWELVNGNDIVYKDTDGRVYTENERWDRIDELYILIGQMEDGEEKRKYERDFVALNMGKEVLFENYVKIPNKVARIFIDESDETLYYSPHLDEYIWGIPYGGDQTKNLTHIPLR